MATAGAAAEIVREIAGVGAADLAAAAEPLRADCLRLARKVSLLTHLVAEVAEAGEDGAAEPEAAAWVADLLRALQAARRFVALGRGPALCTGAADQVTDGDLLVESNLSCIARFLVRRSWRDSVEHLLRDCAASSLRVLQIVCSFSFRHRGSFPLTISISGKILEIHRVDLSAQPVQLQLFAL